MENQNLLQERGNELFDILDSRYDFTGGNPHYFQEVFHAYKFSFLMMTKSPRRYRATFGDENLYIDENSVSEVVRNFALDISGPGYLLDEERKLIRELNREIELLNENYYKESRIGLVS